MKIIYLANIRLPSEKAHAIHIVKMCEALANQGHQVKLLIAKRYNPDFKSQDIFEFYNLKRNFKIKKLFVIDILNLFSRGPYATWLMNLSFAANSFFYVLLHKSDLIYSRDGLPLRFISLFKRNIVYEFHEYRSQDKNFYSKLIQRGTYLITITHNLKKLLIKDGINPTRVLVAPDAVDIKKFEIRNSKLEIRKSLNLPIDKKIILCNSSLYKWKGIYTLVQITNYQLPITNYFIVFVGGMQYDIDRLKRFIQENNLPQEKILILGHKSYKDIPEYLSAADVLVLPNSAKREISLKYTSPLKMFEYMASQKPIVASDLPSIREILNEQNAVLVEPDNSQALAQGICRVLNNSNLAEKISKQAFKDVQKYTWQKRVEKIINFIYSI